MIKQRAFLVAFWLCVCGVVSASDHPFLEKGNLRLEMYPENGSFAVYMLQESGKNRYVPLFDDRNAAATSWFSVQYGSRVFKLAKRSGRPVKFEQLSDGFSYIFSITDDFEVVQLFSFVQQSGGNGHYMVRIESILTNTSGKTGVYAIKALFDTYLGESSGVHFRTDTRKRISTESSIQIGVSTDRYIVSARDHISAMFIINSVAVTLPEQVYIANWERLNTLSWLPEYVEGRSFNTVYSIKDSALLFLWPQKTLSANKKMSVTVLLGSETTISDSPAPLPVGPSAQEIRIQELLKRIDLIEQNPDKATEGEMLLLNRELDLILRNNPER